MVIGGRFVSDFSAEFSRLLLIAAIASLIFLTFLVFKSFLRRTDGLLLNAGAIFLPCA